MSIGLFSHTESASSY